MRCRRMMFPANIWTKSDVRSGFTAPPREFLNRAGFQNGNHGLERNTSALIQFFHELPNFRF